VQTQVNELRSGSRPQPRRDLFYAVTLLLIIVGILVVYKGTAALAVIGKVQNTGTFQPSSSVVPLPGNPTQINILARSINYFAVIWPALLFGVLISGAIRVLNSPSWLTKVVGGGGVRSFLLAGLAGAPLMLCSCCVAPIFSGLYERSSRLGPSLALMLAAPLLNPATLILTLMLFDRHIAVTRLVVVTVIVFFIGVLVEHLFDSRSAHCQPTTKSSNRSTLVTFVQSCLHTAIRTVPLIAIGVFVSMAIALWLPTGSFSSSSGQVLAIVTVAAIAVPLAMPTFFEIPLALLLLSAGAPAGVALAILIAGPAINLPSLFTIARSTNWKIATSVAVAVFLLSILGGLVVTVT
jgi:uncharacterized protein